MCRNLDLDNSDDVEDDEEDLELNETITDEHKNYPKAPSEPIGHVSHYHL